MADHPPSGGDGQAPDQELVPPAGEEVHLPAPSYLPVVVAAGIALALVGIVINFALLVIGLIVATVGIVRWIRETRDDIADLPLEH